MAVSAFCSGYLYHKLQKKRKKKQRNRKKETGKETEMNHLQPTEVITHEDTHSCHKTAILEL